MLTQHRDASHIEQAIQAGAIDYITKPMKGGVLLDKVQRALSKATH
jgi:FixJ family two-component response regulator